jgi:polyisoprenyl-teichoic acid--peptidoglycan teichoic acid transferase
MARRRGASGPPSKRRGPNESSLEALGRQIDESSSATPDTGEPPTTVPNADALRTLGSTIDKSAPTRASRRHRRRHTRRVIGFTSVGLVVLLVGLAGASYYYGYLKYKAALKPLCGTVHKVCDPEVPGKPFNVLAIGSDSRAGLTGRLAAVTGAGSVGGQRSDVVKIFHVDPQAGTISVLSIPRDTVVTLLQNQSLFGNYNRINVNYQNGPELLVRTIEANFGIPINHVIQVDFGGLANAVDSLGGIYMSFPFPALDRYSSLDIHHTGCQLLNGFDALAVARSRHFYYLDHGQWLYDGTSDFGRIDRQNQFLRALIERAKAQATNLPAIAGFLSAIPKGIAIDDTFGYNELLGLALKFHSFNPDAMAAYTMPVVSGYSSSLGDVLFIDQPVAQQMLVKIFGQVGTLGGLTEPTNPPPNSAFATPLPPAVATPRPPAAAAPGHHVAATTQPLHTEPWYTFDPVACTPGVKVAAR